MDPTTVSGWWLSYWLAVAPNDASDVQQTETRRAFYAGVYALLTAMKVEIGNDQVSEDQGVEQFESWSNEVEAFYRQVAAGGA